MSLQRLAITWSVVGMISQMLDHTRPRRDVLLFRRRARRLWLCWLRLRCRLLFCARSGLRCSGFFWCSPLCCRFWSNGNVRRFHFIESERLANGGYSLRTVSESPDMTEQHIEPAVLRDDEETRVLFR